MSGRAEWTLCVTEALGYHILRHEFGAEAADGFVGGALFRVDGLGFLDHRGGNLREVLRARGDFFETALHAVESPEEIDGGGTRLCERIENGGKFSAKFGERFSGGFLHADGYAHRGGDTDGGRAADHHFADGFGHVLIGGVGVEDFFTGKKPLVEHDDATIGPRDGLGYEHER